MAGKHDNQPDPLYPSCEHGELEERKWIQIGMEKLLNLLTIKGVFD